MVETRVEKVERCPGRDLHRSSKISLARQRQSFVRYSQDITKRLSSRTPQGSSGWLGDWWLRDCLPHCLYITGARFHFSLSSVVQWFAGTTTTEMTTGPNGELFWISILLKCLQLSRCSVMRLGERIYHRISEVMKLSANGKMTAQEVTRVSYFHMSAVHVGSTFAIVTCYTIRVFSAA